MRSFSNLLINREYARLWRGQAISTVGDYVFDTTLTLWVATEVVKGKSWAPSAVSGVLLAVGAAVLLVGPVAGVFVDRWSHKKIMLNTELIRAAVVAAVLLLSLIPLDDLPVGLWLGCIYLAVFILNAAGQFFSPARFAAVGALVPGEADRARAAGLGQATTGAASILGPPLAAPLLFSVGVQWAMAANLVSYLCSYAATRSVRFPPSQDTSTVVTDPGSSAVRRWSQDFLSGLRHFAGNRLLVALLASAVITQMGTGALNTLNVFFATGNLHASPGQFGFVSMSFGVGAIGGALVGGHAVGRLGARKATWLGLIVSGLLVCAYSRQSVFVVAVVLLMLVAVPVAALNAAMTPLLLESTPPEYLGRVVAVFNPVNELAYMLSAGVAGWLASTGLAHFGGHVAGMAFGPVDTIFTASGIMIIIAGCYAFFALPRERTAVATPLEAKA
ncbi:MULTISPECIES: MFS transporter [unclassified Streptomyces]|uniref:MFS transporter n=1 Tax=unclassified Streptomyces TaxID=2593676 RepID=UPI002E27D6D7|nr:MFS transporter [Streptomyces sp. NBC_00441]